MGKYFGTDGFRGEANLTLTAQHAFDIGRFLGWYFGGLRRDKGLDGPARILIGKDTRRSGYMLEYSLVGGLTASGADAWLLHVTTTPSVSHLVRTEGFDAGIMISASHNPYFDNGIKLIGGAGEKMEESVIAQLEAYLEGDKNLPLAHRREIGRTVDFVAGRNRYIGYLISLGIYSFKGIKVGLDCANGAAWHIAKSVFDALGAQTYVLHTEPDGCNINENAGSTHMESLQRFVVEQGLDVGFAYDGDADRCLCVDEKGNAVTGDHILYFCGKYLKDQGELTENQVVATVMSNLGLVESLRARGIRTARTAVGDKYVYEYMAAHGCALGGEQSGHIIFSKYASTGDGILTSLKVMEVMLARKKTLSQLCEGLVMYPQVQKNVPVADKASILATPAVQEAIQKAEAMLPDGRILVRPSGTEPVIRILAEGPEEQRCQDAVDLVVRAMEAG